MKKIVLFFTIAIYTSALGQVMNKNRMGGSWINSSVSNFYKSNQSNGCDTNYFEKNEFVPLYISFEAENQVKITYRTEQRIVAYKVRYSGSDMIFSYRGKTVYKVSLLNNVLQLYYKGNLIRFEKVSDSYSGDVFGECIKNLIFKNKKSYVVDSYKSVKYNHTLIDRNNFKDQIKKIFGCDYVDFVQLMFFKYKDVCLPEIALYYKGNLKSGTPQVLGIFQEKSSIKLVDNTGNIILTFNSN